jgi:hypothetical protein
VARIDAHVHILPPDDTAELERRALLPFPLPPWSPELTHGLMERHAIDAAVMSLSPPGSSRASRLGEAAPAGPLAYLGRLYYDTGLANNELALRTTLAIADPAQVVFGTDWPYADLPASGDPAPGLAAVGDDLRGRIDAANAAALVPRLVAAVVTA